MPGESPTERILVVGAGGFLGRSIAKSLHQNGYQIVGAGREGISSALKTSYDGIVWAAGDNYSMLQERHVWGPLQALKSLSSGGRFVYLSSGQTYGAIPVPFREDSTPLGTTAYAKAKLAGEEALRQATKPQDQTLTIFRISLAYGPTQIGSMFVPALLDHLVLGKHFSASPGAQTRDYIYSEDVARAVLLAFAPQAPGGLYNLGSGLEISLKDMALKLVRCFDIGNANGCEALIGFGDLPYRDNEQMRYVLDMSKTRQAFGFESRISLDEGIANVVSAARNPS